MKRTNYMNETITSKHVSASWIADSRTASTEDQAIVASLWGIETPQA